MSISQETIDRVAINEVGQRYAKALDLRNYQELKTVFAPNAQLAYTIGDDRYFAFPMAEAIDTFSSFLSRCYWTCHLIGTGVVDIDGERAHASSRVHATHIQIRNDGSKNIWIVSGGYEDDLIRTPDGWRIIKRDCICPYEEGSFEEEGVREFNRAPTIDDFRK